MNLAQPGWLGLLLLLPLLTLAAVLASRQRGRQWQAFVAPRLRGALLKQGNTLPRWLGLAGLGMATVFLILSLTRPQGDAGIKTEKTIGRNVLIALDLSRSMRVADVSPDRLGQAKVVIYELLEALPNDRVGLLGFAGRAHLYAPLTIDHSAVRETVEQIDENWAPVGGSDLSSAVKLAIDTFKETGQKNNALVILSDGEENNGKLEEIIRQAEQAGVYIYAIGVGTEGGGYVPSKEFKGENMIDRNGHPVLSTFHREVMAKLAQETHGTFVMAGSGAELTTLVRSAIGQLDSFEQKGRERRLFTEYYQWLLFPAIILLVVAIILGTHWRKLAAKTAPAMVVVFLLTIICIPRANANGAASAKEALQKGRYEEATKLYDYLAKKAMTEEFAAPYRLGQGTSAYRNQDYRNARQGFSQALLSNDADVRGMAQLGLGNTQFQLGWQGLTGKSFPTDPEQVPNLDRFETLVKEKLAELRQKELPDTGDTELFRTFDSIIVNWVDAIRHYDSAGKESSSVKGPKTNRATTLAYLKRLKELLKEEESQAQQAMQQAGMGQPQQGKGEEGEAGDEEGNGDGNNPREDGAGSDGQEKNKKGKGGDEDKNKEGKDPNEGEAERARRLLKENSDMEKGPLTPGRREFRDPEKDW